MNLSYETFIQEFDALIGDEWTCLFDLYHKKLNLKNLNLKKQMIREYKNYGTSLEK